MRIAVFGAGGAGGYFGARLARSGNDVVWIARGAQLEVLRTRGLRVESIDGDFTLGPQNAAEDPARFAPVDAVLLGVKAWQVTDAARAMRPLVGPATCVVPFQNGVEAADRLRGGPGGGRAPGGVRGGVGRGPSRGRNRKVFLLPRGARPPAAAGRPGRHCARRAGQSA